MPTYTSNFNFSMPLVNNAADANIWGTELNSNWNAIDPLLRAVASSNAGTTAPTDPAPERGQMWLNTAGATYPLNIYDGTNWVSMGVVDPISHVFTPSSSTTINVVKFTSSGTYTPSSGLVSARIQVVGGGGGGGGRVITSASQMSAGSGGGGGAYSEGQFSAAAIAGSTKDVFVGAGGLGVLGAAGGNGGNSGFGTLITVVGGGGGGSLAVASTSTFPIIGGAGGTAGAGGSINTAGQNGYTSISSAPNNSVSGSGGNSFIGGGAPGVQTASGNLPGNAALSNSGGGGSGAVNGISGTAGTGGNGGSGIVIITEYILA